MGSRVTGMNTMFMYAFSFQSDISKWDVSKVTDMTGMFTHAESFQSDVSKWDVSSVTNLDNMCEGAKSFQSDISKWDVSKVTAMTAMFMHASSFNVDISKWDVSRVSDMTAMFMGAKSFEQELCGAAWVRSKARKEKMFQDSAGSISRTVCTFAPNSGITRSSTFSPGSNSELKNAIGSCLRSYTKNNRYNGKMRPIST